MQNFVSNFMVEISSITKKQSSSYEAKLTWRDIQGLGWTLEEDVFESNNKFSAYAQA